MSSFTVICCHNLPSGWSPLNLFLVKSAPFRAYPQKIIFLHLAWSLAFFSVTPTLSISSSALFPLYLLPGRSMFNILCPTYPVPSLHMVKPFQPWCPQTFLLLFLFYRKPLIESTDLQSQCKIPWCTLGFHLSCRLMFTVVLINKILCFLILLYIFHNTQ